MLSLHSGSGRGACGGISRREFIRIGSLGLGGLALPDLLAARAQAADADLLIKDKSVVLLFLAGGPPQHETFDPKIDIPSQYRSMLGEVKTKLPGVNFGGTFPRLAAMADRLAIVRSCHHDNTDHDVALLHVNSGGNPLQTVMGSLYSRIAGPTHPVTGLPRGAIISPRTIDPKKYPVYKGEVPLREKFYNVGTLSPAYRPFNPSTGGQLVENMRLQIPARRMSDRRSLLESLDQIKRSLDGSKALEATDRFQQQALDVVLRGAGEAFDLTQEDPRIVERYDTSQYYKNKSVPNKAAMAESWPMVLGRQMLMARRLCEAGCGFVTVISSQWDLHANEDTYGIVDGMNYLGPALDHAASAFLEDVHQRGLSEKILLVITGEMGRTPAVNKKAGRDHWGQLCPLIFAGGGLRMGQVIGKSDRQGGAPVADPVSTQDMMATIMQSLLDMGQLRIAENIPPEVRRALAGGKPIKRLF